MCLGGRTLRRAETAILYSVAHDIWAAELDSTHGHERMHTWLALRHAQIPVDVISDEVLRAPASLKDASSSISTASSSMRAMPRHLRSGMTAASPALDPEAGSRDELNRPGNALDGALGIHRGAGKTLQQIWHSGHYICTGLKPKGKVIVGHETVDLLAHSQAIDASAGAEVLARFEDGKPAAVMQAVGQGRVVQYGFMPALAYIRTAHLHGLEVRDTEPAVQLPAVAKAAELAGEGAFAEATGATFPRVSAAPVQFSAALRDLLTEPARVAKVARPVELSTPQIEATFLEGKRGAGWFRWQTTCISRKG